MEFTPTRFKGLMLLTIISILFLAGGSALSYLAFQQENSGILLLMLVGGIIFVLPVIVVAYNVFALLRARYLLDRDGLRIRWGLRSEDIPSSEIKWVRPIGQMGYNVATPLFSFLGIMQGILQSDELGRVEFFATNPAQTLLVATSRDVYAISPQETNRFLDSLRDVMERGSLSPISWQTVRPEFFITHALKESRVRNPIIAGFILNLAFIIIASILMPRLGNIQLGYAAPMNEPVPANRLLLLAILSLLTFVIAILGGFFFYRKESTQHLAQMLFLSSSITPILLFISLVFLFT